MYKMEIIDFYQILLAKIIVLLQDKQNIKIKMLQINIINNIDKIKEDQVKAYILINE